MRNKVTFGQFLIRRATINRAGPQTWLLYCSIACHLLIVTPRPLLDLPQMSINVGCSDGDKMNNDAL